MRNHTTLLPSPYKKFTEKNWRAYSPPFSQKTCLSKQYVKVARWRRRHHGWPCGGLKGTEWLWPYGWGKEALEKEAWSGGVIGDKAYRYTLQIGEGLQQQLILDTITSQINSNLWFSSANTVCKTPLHTYKLLLISPLGSLHQLWLVSLQRLDLMPRLEIF